MRPGMDLTKIALPTFVLEPRSLLERITDFFSHPDLVFGCVLSEEGGKGERSKVTSGCGSVTHVQRRCHCDIQNVVWPCLHRLMAG